jgi:hypothetical protein
MVNSVSGYVHLMKVIMSINKVSKSIDVIIHGVRSRLFTTFSK